MKVDIPADKAKVLKADGRGRVSIGREYADQEVEVVVLDDAEEALDKRSLLERLEVLEEGLHDTEHTELRELASQLRIEVGEKALAEAFNETVKQASEGDTILFDEAGGNVENLSERGKDE